MSNSLEKLKQAIEQKDKSAAVQFLNELSELNDQDRADALIMLAQLQSEVEDDINQELLPLLQQAILVARQTNQAARELQDSQKLDDLRKGLNS